MPFLSKGLMEYLPQGGGSLLISTLTLGVIKKAPPSEGKGKRARGGEGAGRRVGKRGIGRGGWGVEGHQPRKAQCQESRAKDWEGQRGQREEGGSEDRRGTGD